MKENSYDLNARLTLSPHTRRVRVAEKIAKSILWIAAAITMGTLLLIVGYILYRGFVSDMRIQYDVLPGGSSIIAADEVDARGIAIIVNRIIRADDLQIRDVVELFNGGRDNWGGISEQDIDVQVFGRIEGDPVKVEFERSVFVEGPVYADGAVFVDSDSEVIKNVSQTLGGIGYISAANINQLEGSDAKVLEIRRISIVTNPAVTEFHEGQRIRYLTGEQVSGIFSGQYNNWS